MEKRIEMFQALMKTPSGYISVLSDDSLDRDGEIVGKSALQKVINSQNGKLPILLNHENKIENLIGEWINRRLEERHGHSALVAEPKFYMSNPKAKMIKGILDDGAECGISIGAIVKDSEVRKINGSDTLVFTDIELLEASFVAIPSNMHSAAMAVAKSFVQTEEVSKMGEERPVEIKPAEEIVEKPVEEVKTEPVVEEETSVVEEPKTEESAIEEDKSVIVELQKKVESMQEQINKLSKEPMNKGNFETKEADVPAEIEKDTEGKLPIMRG